MWLWRHAIGVIRMWKLADFRLRRNRHTARCVLRRPVLRRSAKTITFSVCVPRGITPDSWHLAIDAVCCLYLSFNVIDIATVLFSIPKFRRLTFVQADSLIKRPPGVVSTRRCAYAVFLIFFFIIRFPVFPFRLSLIDAAWPSSKIYD